MRISALFVIMFAVISQAAIASAFDMSPTNPGPGDQIVITGTASPGQELIFQTSFKMILPVDGGRYEYQASSIEIPQKPNRFAVSASGIKDLNVGVKFGVWITKGFKASNGAAHISQSDVPPGRYDLKVFGDAADGKTGIPLEITAETQVKAGPDGKYSLVIDTSGLPGGEYTIRGPDGTKTVEVGGTKPSTGSSSSSSKYASSGSDESSSGSTARQTENAAAALEITPDIVKWYAISSRLDPQKPDQYEEAEKRLKQMTSGGYWKIIAQGAPLTEHAGNCQDKYCLVRNSGACTTCRDEEMRLIRLKSSGKEVENKSLNRTENIAKPSIQNASKLEASRADGGFITWILQILHKIFGIMVGG